jgi:germacradienol/geosmin synthase
LQQFENTFFTELAPLFDEYALDAKSRLDVLAYAKGLQDWQSGGHEWHMRSSRYMNERSTAAGAGSSLGIFHPGPVGLGTAAAQLATAPGALGLNRARAFTHLSHQNVGAVQLPKIYMPYPLRLNPHLDNARRTNLTWSREMGLLDEVPGLPGAGIWNERQLVGCDLALCAAGLDPDGSAAELDLGTAWLTWGTYADDYFPARFNSTRDMAGAKAFIKRLPLFMPLDSTTTPAPTNPVERALADVWLRTAAPMAASDEVTSSGACEARAQFRHTIEDMLDSWLWELANHIQHRIPDPIDYVEMRRKTFGSDLTMSLARLAHGNVVPPEVYRSTAMRGLDNSASDYACLVNDIFSYQKEIQFEGELHNGVLVVQNFLDCDLPQAVTITNELMTARLRQFERIVAVDLPQLFEDFQLDAAARDTLTGYVQELQNWLAGILNWHRLSTRYFESELRRLPTAALSLATFPWATPTGLGTSAAHLPIPRAFSGTRSP